MGRELQCFGIGHHLLQNPAIATAMPEKATCSQVPETPIALNTL
jgi:hypothetical protein